MREDVAIIFKTQQEIWKWLVEGGEVEYLDSRDTYRFIDGGISYPYSFSHPLVWKKVIPKKTVKLRMWVHDAEHYGVTDWVVVGSSAEKKRKEDGWKPTNWTKEVEIIEDDE